MLEYHFSIKYRNFSAAIANDMNGHGLIEEKLLHTLQRAWRELQFHIWNLCPAQELPNIG